MSNRRSVFLLMGQSNMAGRGRLDEVPAKITAQEALSVTFDGRAAAVDLEIDGLRE